MTAIAPSPYQTQTSSELGAQQLPPAERDKLQEIHELINLLLRAFPVTAENRTATMPILPAAPYTYSLLNFPCG